MKHAHFAFLLLIAATALADDRAKNLILFVGDAGGLSTLHAASVHRYGEPAVLGLGRKAILAAMQEINVDLVAGLKQRGYFFGESLPRSRRVPPEPLC